MKILATKKMGGLTTLRFPKLLEFGISKKLKFQHFE
jgi:hypothetical protein